MACSARIMDLMTRPKRSTRNHCPDRIVTPELIFHVQPINLSVEISHHRLIYFFCLLQECSMIVFRILEDFLACCGVLSEKPTIMPAEGHNCTWPLAAVLPKLKSSRPVKISCVRLKTGASGFEG
jgi:hypothetical protein